MPRRIHVPRLIAGETALDRAQAHHARNVLRLTEGATVEVFDDAGRTAAGVLAFDGASDVRVRVDHVTGPSTPGSRVRLIVAAAVPRGERADWLVEKLAELGVAEFVPLAAARSVVLPEGRNKRDRWSRIATEAAKQSRGAGVMRVAELTRLGDALASAIAPEPAVARRAWYLATESAVPTQPVARAVAALARGTILTAFIGPEGGWTPDELQAFASAGAWAIRLTDAILRVETAAVALAAVVGTAMRNTE